MRSESFAAHRDIILNTMDDNYTPKALNLLGMVED
jgi:hypothetical protein